jgi:hypothetical protein
VPAESRIPSNITDLQFELNSGMRRKSQSLTSSCRQYAVSRNKRFPSSTFTVEDLDRQISSSINNPGSLRSRVRQPMALVADLVASLVAEVPNRDEFEAALRAEGLDVPAASVIMESVLLSYEDASSSDVRERGNAILQSLEERGYDRGRDLLLVGSYQEFATMDPTDASYSSSMMERMRQVGSKLTRRRNNV